MSFLKSMTFDWRQIFHDQRLVLDIVNDYRSRNLIGNGTIDWFDLPCVILIGADQRVLDVCIHKLQESHGGQSYIIPATSSASYIDEIVTQMRREDHNKLLIVSDDTRHLSQHPYINMLINCPKTIKSRTSLVVNIPNASYGSLYSPLRESKYVIFVFSDNTRIIVFDMYEERLFELV